MADEPPSGATPLDARDSGSREGGASFSLSNRMVRVAWQICWSLTASWTPPPLHGWRRLVLRVFGARIGKGARIYGRAKIWLPSNLSVGDFAVIGPGVNCYNQGAIAIGDYATISQGAHLCASTHNISDPQFQLIIRPIRIGAQAWIAADAFVGPGVKVGEGAVLGARGVAIRDLDAWTVYRGNPAERVGERRVRA